MFLISCQIKGKVEVEPTGAVGGPVDGGGGGGLARRVNSSSRRDGGGGGGGGGGGPARTARSRLPFSMGAASAKVLQKSRMREAAFALSCILMLRQ